MTVPRWWSRWGETVLVPLGLVLMYVALVETSGAKGTARYIALFFLLIVLALWFAFRRLKLHAQASRLAGVGEPEALLALVERELPQCLTEASRRPLHVHAAIAHNLRGDFAAARKALDTSGLLTPTRRTRGWAALAAATDVTTRCESGDVAGARLAFDRQVAPLATVAPYGGMELVARECQARLALADGDATGARALLTPLAKNIRLADASRAQIHALLARAADALGDDAARATHAKAARELAPRCKLLPDGFAA